MQILELLLHCWSSLPIANSVWDSAVGYHGSQCKEELLVVELVSCHWDHTHGGGHSEWIESGFLKETLPEKTKEPRKKSMLHLCAAPPRFFRSNFKDTRYSEDASIWAIGDALEDFSDCFRVRDSKCFGARSMVPTILRKLLLKRISFQKIHIRWKNLGFFVVFMISRLWASQHKSNGSAHNFRAWQDRLA